MEIWENKANLNLLFQFKMWLECSKNYSVGVSVYIKQMS